MTKEEALDIVCDIASRWGENVEEDFARRVQATDDDAACLKNASESNHAPEEVTEVRDLWRAIKLLQPA